MTENTQLVPMSVSSAQEFSIVKAAMEGPEAVGELTEAFRTNFENEQLDISSLDRIKVPSGGGTMWSIPTLAGEQEVKTFSAIVPFFYPGRNYWAVAMEDSDGSSPPDCYSVDMAKGIGTPGGECAVCPFNAYGSGKGGTGKACKEFRTLFLLLPGSVFPVMLNVPPTSLKEFSGFRMRLAQAGIPLNRIVVHFSLDKEKNRNNITFSAVKFSADPRKDLLPPDAAKALLAYANGLKPLFDRTHANLARSGQSAESSQGSGEGNPFE